MMKPLAMATIGVRLVGLAAIAFGCVLGMTDAGVRGVLKLAFGRAELHDTYYLIEDWSSGLLLSGGCGIIVGGVLFLLSRRIADLIVRGLIESEDEQ
jgi:hypothetical protein